MMVDQDRLEEEVAGGVVVEVEEEEWVEDSEVAVVEEEVVLEGVIVVIGLEIKRVVDLRGVIEAIDLEVKRVVVVEAVVVTKVMAIQPAGNHVFAADRHTGSAAAVEEELAVVEGNLAEAGKAMEEEGFNEILTLAAADIRLYSHLSRPQISHVTTSIKLKPLHTLEA